MESLKNTPFRFFDNREKYLLFVTTCSEKKVTSERISLELSSIRPTPPAIRLFDAGMGDATVLTNVMRYLHYRFPTIPFYICAKEISLEDVRIGLDKMADRFHEHPQTVLILTNMFYSEAPWLTPKKKENQDRVNWLEVPLEGNTSHDFDMQIRALQDTLPKIWQNATQPKTGNPVYKEPSVVVLYRADQRFMLDHIIPNPGQAEANFDLIIAAQSYRARMSARLKIKNVLKPLAQALKPGGRMVVIQATGNDPGKELVQAVWPGEEPFITPRRDLIAEMRMSLQKEMPDLIYHMYSDQRSLFRYQLSVMPSQTGENIGTSTVLAAWNAAIYVAQIEDQRVTPTLTDGSYIAPTEKILNKYNGLWFMNETFAIEKKE